VRIDWRLAALLATGLSTAACGAGVAAAQPHPAASAVAAAKAAPGSAASPDAASAGAASTGSTSTGSVSTGSTSTSRASTGSASPAVVAGSGSGQGAAVKPLAGKVIGIDPGHNGRNRDDPTFINHPVWNGRTMEACDTTGTETNAGYTEARFTFNVASYLRADLRKDGARVVMTRYSNNGVGPCVNRRATILNKAHSNVAIDIHGDGGPASGRGFTVIEPIKDGPNNKVIKSSVRFGSDVRSAMLKHTRMPVSNYYGHNGVILRSDLAGLNLTTVPKILIETGNMRNVTDAGLLRTTWFQKQLAKAFTAAIVKFLG
jgi:N-acetylmuramoyl-L-alanine amidase